jgi:hypothetical protein
MAPTDERHVLMSFGVLLKRIAQTIVNASLKTHQSLHFVVQTVVRKLMNAFSQDISNENRLIWPLILDVYPQEFCSSLME